MNGDTVDVLSLASHRLMLHYRSMAMNGGCGLPIGAVTLSPGMIGNLNSLRAIRKDKAGM